MIEEDYATLLKKFQKLPKTEIVLKIADIRQEMADLGGGNFSTLNDSSNNLKYAVLVQLLEEKDK